MLGIRNPYVWILTLAGDFWHVRGMLPVNPLNRVLEEFRDWKCPTLMLVGNHDQVRNVQRKQPPSTSKVHALVIPNNV